MPELTAKQQRKKAVLERLNQKMQEHETVCVGFPPAPPRPPGFQMLGKGPFSHFHISPPWEPRDSGLRCHFNYHCWVVEVVSDAIYH